MKTAISVPDPIGRRVDRAAKRLKMSRSELYTRAVIEYLSAHEESDITAAYDKAFSDDKDDTRDFRRTAAKKALKNTAWK